MAQSLADGLRLAVPMPLLNGHLPKRAPDLNPRSAVEDKANKSTKADRRFGDRSAAVQVVLLRAPATMEANFCLEVDRGRWKKILNTTKYVDHYYFGRYHKWCTVDFINRLKSESLMSCLDPSQGS